MEEIAQVLRKIYSRLTRPFRTFNIANRAERIISQEKPMPAPQYTATERQRELVDKVNPHFLEDHYKKNAQLDQRLKDVFVTSTDPQVEQQTRESKSLPQSRQSSWEVESIYEPYDSMMIPVGKCSLKQALTFILQHKHDPIMYSSENIASEYKMNKKVVDDILKHFKVYVTVMPNKLPEIEEDPIQELINKSIEVKKEKLKKKDVEKKK